MCISLLLAAEYASEILSVKCTPCHFEVYLDDFGVLVTLIVLRFKDTQSFNVLVDDFQRIHCTFGVRHED